MLSTFSVGARRVAVVEVQRVARRVEEDRLVADAAVHGVGDELDAVGLEVFPRGGDVFDLKGDRQPVGPELLTERGGFMTASVRFPAWNSAPGMSPHRLPGGRPSTVP